MDISSLGITGVAAITIICLLIGQGVKASSLDSKFIPIICGVCGAVLGVVGMFLMPDFPATDYITAAAVGIVSGLAATGANQVMPRYRDRPHFSRRQSLPLPFRGRSDPCWGSGRTVPEHCCSVPG